MDAGNIVHASDTTPLTVITQLQPISVVFTLPQQTLPAVASAMAQGSPEVLALAQGVATAAVLDRGQVAVLDNTVDQATGTIKLKATFPNAGLKLWPGGFVNVRLLVQTLQRRGDGAAGRGAARAAGAYVYLLNADDTVKPQGRAGGARGRGGVRGDGRAAAGRPVVVDGASRLTDGAQVKVPDAGTARRRTRRRAAAPRAPGAGGQRRLRRATVNISAPFIARPIATWLLAVAVLLAGLLGYRALPVSALPQVDFPTIQVSTQLPGASPEVTRR